MAVGGHYCKSHLPAKAARYLLNGESLVREMDEGIPRRGSLENGRPAAGDCSCLQSLWLGDER
jgi:hypothetical protein